MLYARHSGRIEWICPACEVYQISHYKARHKALWCMNCKALLYVGLVLYKAPMGPKPLPAIDTFMIGGGFTLKREVNRVYCAGCGEEVMHKALQKMITHDLTPILAVEPKVVAPSKPRGSKPWGHSYAADDELTG